MIQKQNSKQLMDSLHNSEQSIQKLNDDISVMNNELTKHLSVIRNAQEFALKQMLEVKELIKDGYDSHAKNRIVFTRGDIVDGNFDVFGSTVHPAFVKAPTNVFNFGTSTGKVFKNNANVRINDTAKESYKDMLMHDSIPNKGIAFDEFDEPEITLEIEINPDDLLGATDFNIIELLPYLPGSFDIQEIRVFTMADYRQDGLTPSHTLSSNIENFGASRVLMGKTLQLWKCQIDILLKFQNANGKYPFGVKHCYFLKGNYDPDSYIVARVSRDKFVDWISEDIQMHDQKGIYASTCKEEGIELYMSYLNDVLSLEISTSLGLGQNPIPKNIREFYVKVPLDRSIISMKFDEIKDR